MSSAAERDSRPLVYGLRIGVWYATLFVAGSMAIVSLTAWLGVLFAGRMLPFLGRAF